MLVKDMISFRGGPKPGEDFPDFELSTIDGGTISKADIIGQKPIMIIFGSYTCPMTASSSGPLKRIHQQFLNQVEFLTLYVREAHPGDYYNQATTIDEKSKYAQDLKERDQIPWKIGVDDLDGSLHRQLGSLPNAVYILDSSGKVAYRVLWANDERAVRKALMSVLSGEIGQDKPMIVPMLSGLGTMAESLERSGPIAKKDVLKQAPPMFLMAQIAKQFKGLSPLKRGMAAAGSVAAATLGAIYFKNKVS
jgi:peroxiredoxin